MKIELSILEHIHFKQYKGKNELLLKAINS